VINLIRKIALILAVAVFTVACMPIYTFAADEGLEAAIKTVKQYFTIPDGFKEFDYGVGSIGDRRIWDLYWYSTDGSTISASVDNNGDIINYSFYDYSVYDNIKRLFKINRQEAKAKAEEIVKKINPEIYDSLKFIDTNPPVLSDDVYYFNYIRTYNGIPFPQNNISVSINRRTGEIQQYIKQWDNDLIFPSFEKVLNIEEAQKAYIEKLGLRLTYNSLVSDDKTEIYAAYTPKYNSNYYIDALTGEKVFLGYYYYGFDDAVYNEKLKDAIAVGEGGIELSPQEIEAVNEVSKLLTQEEVEKKIKGIKFLELDENYILSSAGLSRSWASKDDFIWRLYFEKRISEASKGFDYVYVTVDAKNGEIRSFSRTYNDIDDKEPKFDINESRKESEKIIKELVPEKFAQTEYQETDDYRIFLDEKEKPKTYSFNYVRNVNGVLFPENNISVIFDAVNGRILNFNIQWFEPVFPSVENAIPIDKIYEKLFSEMGLSLQYRMDYNTSINSDALKLSSLQPLPERNAKLRLVYALDESKPIIFDAFTGEILGYDGKPYKENKMQEYNDISGHYAEEVIKLLAENGIALEGPEFRPNEEIKQKDFLLLVSQILNVGYRFYGKTAIKDDKEVEDLYLLLIREGIVKQDEKDPEASLTREESVKFLIRVLKYDKVAELGDIFNCTFKDKDEISPNLIGYVVIAKGLKIVSGDGEYFRPKNKLSRADAILLIYNYLQIQ